MKFIQSIVDNSTALTGLVLAVIGVLTAFNIAEMTDVQIGAVTALLGALVLFLSKVLTTVKRTVVTQVDNDGVIRAGAGADSPTGSRTPVMVNPDGSLVPQVTVKPELAVAGD